DRTVLRAPLPVAQPRDGRRADGLAARRGDGPAAQAAPPDPRPARDQRAAPAAEEAARPDQARPLRPGLDLEDGHRGRDRTQRAAVADLEARRRGPRGPPSRT